jgi:hypothetical protein
MRRPSGLPLVIGIDDGRIGIELHADPQPVAIDPGDHPPLGRLAGLLLDDRGEDHRLRGRRDGQSPGLRFAHSAASVFVIAACIRAARRPGLAALIAVAVGQHRAFLGHGARRRSERGRRISRSWTMIDGMPSGTVTSRCTGFAVLQQVEDRRMAGIPGISNSPAWIGSPPPNSRAWKRNARAEAIAPAFSSCAALWRGSSLPRRRPCAAPACGPGAVPALDEPETDGERGRGEQAEREQLRMRSSDGLHHQAGVGAAEAEAVVEHRLDGGASWPCAGRGRPRPCPRSDCRG